MVGSATTVKRRPSHLRRLVACFIAALPFLAGCGVQATPPALGLVVITAGGESLVDGLSDVPPTLDLRLQATGPLDIGGARVTLDQRDLPLNGSPSDLAVSVPPLPLGSGHDMTIDIRGREPLHVHFTVVAPSAVSAALHGADGATVVDVAFERAPQRAAVERAIGPGMRPTWSDSTHLRLVPTSGGASALNLPWTIPTDRGSHLAGNLALDLASPLPAGTMRRVVVPPAGLAPGLDLTAFTVGTSASRASLQQHDRQVDIISPVGLRIRADGTLIGRPDPAAVSVAASASRSLWPLVQNDAADTSSTTSLLGSTDATQRLADALGGQVAAHGWGGIHLDIEGVPADQRDRLTALIRAVAAAVHRVGGEVAVDVVPHKPGHLTIYSAAYDLAAIHQVADQVVLMAYDQHAAAGDAGPVAGLDWDSEILDGSLPDLDAAHTVLGLPLYGRTWTDSGATADSYSAIVASMLARPHPVVDYDFAAATLELRADGPSGSPVVAYVDDADSLARKAHLAAARGMHGVAVWRLGFEDAAAWNVLP